MNSTRRSLLVCTALAFLVAPAEARTKRPDFTPGGTATVRTVVDGQSLVLEDGRQVRLAGIEAPLAKADSALAARAREALEKLTAGKEIELGFAGTPADRHGTAIAQLFAGRRWIQGELVRRGLARVHGLADNRIGLRELLAIEATARKSRRGIWAKPFYAPRTADEAGRDNGSFQLVEGKVVTTASVDGDTYLNFAEDWRSGFSVRVGRAALALCRAAGLDLPSLKGQKLRVRGFIDGVKRPTLDVTHPEQIEIL